MSAWITKPDTDGYYWWRPNPETPPRILWIEPKVNAIYEDGELADLDEFVRDNEGEFQAVREAEAAA